MEEGIVLFFDPVKGFGKILHPNEGEIFVHLQHLRDQIYGGDKVSFKLRTNSKGLLNAEEVTKLKA